MTLQIAPRMWKNTAIPATRVAIEALATEMNAYVFPRRIGVGYSRCLMPL
jgi:hypothetical protein